MQIPPIFATVEHALSLPRLLARSDVIVEVSMTTTVEYAASELPIPDDVELSPSLQAMKVTDETIRVVQNHTGVLSMQDVTVHDDADGAFSVYMNVQTLPPPALSEWQSLTTTMTVTFLQLSLLHEDPSTDKAVADFKEQMAHALQIAEEDDKDPFPDAQLLIGTRPLYVAHGIHHVNMRAALPAINKMMDSTKVGSCAVLPKKNTPHELYFLHDEPGPAFEGATLRFDGLTPVEPE